MFPSLRPDQYQVLNKYPSSNPNAEKKAASLQWKREHYVPDGLSKKKRRQLKLRHDWEQLAQKAREHLDHQRLDTFCKLSEPKKNKRAKRQANLRKFQTKKHLTKLEFVTAKADHLRANQTSYEKRLGKAIKGLGFQPQVVIHVYIADFYHAKHKIIVEADGSQHSNSPKQVNHDKIRTKYLQSKGYKVLRFSNSEIHKDLNSCVLRVREEIKSATLVPPFAQARPASK